MGSPSYPSSPGDQAGPPQPGTAGIPVLRPAAAPVTKQLPPHPGATALGAQPTTAVHPQVQPAPPQPTGPVDFVPKPPGAPGPPLPTAAAPVPTWPETLEGENATQERKGRALRLPRDRGVLVPIGLAALAVVLLQLGLSLELDSASSWNSVPLWSAFATAATVTALVCLVVAVLKRGRPTAELAWRAAAAAMVGLAVFWLLVVLPVADGDRGFLLTAALGSLGAALWMAAERD